MRIYKHILFIFFISLFTSLSAGNNTQIDSLLKITETAKDTTLINSLLQLAKIQMHSNKDTVIYYLLKAEKEALKVNDEKGYSEALFMHGNILYYNNNYSEAEDYFNQCLELSDKKNNKLLKARSLERIASLRLATNNAHLALRLYYESLTIFEELNNLKGIAKVYNILGIYKADTEEFAHAESYLKKSLEIHEQLKDKRNIIENKGNLGYLYEQTGDIEKAEEIYKQLIPEIQEVNDLYALPIIYYNLASIYQNKGETSEALDFLNRAISISEQSNDTSLLSSLYGNSAELYIKTNDIDSARLFLGKAVLCSKSIGSVETEMQALELMAYIDSLSTDYTSAISTYKLILPLKDTLYKRKLKHLLQESELRYENQKNQSKIALQEKIIRSDKKNKWLFMTLFIILSIAVLLLVWLLLLQKKSLLKSKKIHTQQIKLKQLEINRILNEEKIQNCEKEKMEEELSIKERELVTSALQMERSHVELSFIKEKIKDLLNQESINHFELVKLEQTIKLKLKDSDNWDLFYKTFNEVHKDFFKDIKTKHPTLTKSELKHCAYIRIHLSSVQISSLLNVTIEAVRKTRYRIRKKLELEPNDSLENYLLKF